MAHVLNLAYEQCRSLWGRKKWSSSQLYSEWVASLPVTYQYVWGLTHPSALLQLWRSAWALTSQTSAKWSTMEHLATWSRTTKKLGELGEMGMACSLVTVRSSLDDRLPSECLVLYSRQDFVQNKSVRKSFDSFAFISSGCQWSNAKTKIMFYTNIKWLMSLSSIWRRGDVAESTSLLLCFWRFLFNARTGWFYRTLENVQFHQTKWLQRIDAATVITVVSRMDSFLIDYLFSLVQFWRDQNLPSQCRQGGRHVVASPWSLTNSFIMW
jgi:hypothetical protein